MCILPFYVGEAVTLMDNRLPQNALDALDWKKEQYEPFFQALIEREITAENVNQWLADWSELTKLANEVVSRLNVATTVDTTDEAAEQRLRTFLGEVLPALMSYDDKLNRKLVESGLEPEGFEVPLRKIRAAVELFREENLPLISETRKLGIEYDKIIGAQTIQWEGEEVTLPQIQTVYQEQDRERRERAWRLATERQLADREKLNDLWKQLLDLRVKIAHNADLPDFRAYTWKGYNRFDYTPEESIMFQNAIEQVVVPAAKRLYERKRQQLGVDTLRPWDAGGEPTRAAGPDPAGRPALRPYETAQELEEKLLTIFNRVDPQLGDYFRIMREENLLDLENRKGKAPGGYCTMFPLAQRPFIFMNAVGIHDDVQTLLHEGGHAFHVFEMNALPYAHQQDMPIEFAEVASMAMELIAAPYLTSAEGGFYSEEDAARARMEHLENLIRFWPYMAVVDAFQHWVYTNHEAASDPANCDAKWGELWDRFMVGVDYSGFEDVKVTGWHRKLHIFQIPFYYVEYGLAQLGAVQVWANSLEDQAKAVQDYRRALALGGTANLPVLFATAGAKFAFDAGTISGAVALVEHTLNQLDGA
jgi:oligoendopeptidase F